MDTTHGARRIELIGEYDLSQKAEVAALFGALAPDGPATINMTEVSYVDSSFLHELLKLRKRLGHPITLLGRRNAVSISSPMGRGGPKGRLLAGRGWAFVAELRPRLPTGRSAFLQQSAQKPVSMRRKGEIA